MSCLYQYHDSGVKRLLPPVWLCCCRLRTEANDSKNGRDTNIVHDDRISSIAGILQHRGSSLQNGPYMTTTKREQTCQAAEDGKKKG